MGRREERPRSACRFKRSNPGSVGEQIDETDPSFAARGIVSTKGPEMEPADELKRRIEDAAKFAPLDRLSLTTQCGFASPVKGNPLSIAEEEAKLSRIVEVPRDVWGEA